MANSNRPGLAENVEVNGVRFTRKFSSDVVVMTDLHRLDQAWKRENTSQYIGHGGTGFVIGDRYKQFEAFLAKAKESGTAIVMPEAGFGGGLIGFTNGRHRTAVFRDLGFKAIPFAVDRSSVKEWKRRFDPSVSETLTEMPALPPHFDKPVNPKVTVVPEKAEFHDCGWPHDRYKVCPSKGVTAEIETNVPVILLRKLKGGSNEDRRWRKVTLDNGEKVWAFGNMLPDEFKAFIDSIATEGLHYSITLVAHKGQSEPFVYEGNHRILAAYLMGLPTLPVRMVFHGHSDTLQHGWVRDIIERLRPKQQESFVSLVAARLSERL